MILFLNNVLYSNFELTTIRDGVEITTLDSVQLRVALQNTLDFYKNDIFNALDAQLIDSVATRSYIRYTIEKSKEYVQTEYNNKCALLNNTLDTDLKYFNAYIVFNKNIFSLSLLEEKESLQKSLDYEAGKVRAKMVSEGSFVGEEYLLAHAEALAWTNAGNNEEDVPETISIWASVSNISNIAAAEDIIQTRILLNKILTTIRSIRLLGKSEIASAITSASANIEYSKALAKLAAISN